MSTPDRGRTAAWRLAALLTTSGTLHFVIPKVFDAVVPRLLPGSARSYTYASGVAELAVAGALTRPQTRHIGGLAAAALFIAVFPANVQMAVNWWRSSTIPLPLKISAVLRLPLQIPLVTESLKASRVR